MQEGVQLGKLLLFRKVRPALAAGQHRDRARSWSPAPFCCSPTGYCSSSLFAALFCKTVHRVFLCFASSSCCADSDEPADGTKKLVAPRGETNAAASNRLVVEDTNAVCSSRQLLFLLMCCVDARSACGATWLGSCMAFVAMPLCCEDMLNPVPPLPPSLPPPPLPFPSLPQGR